MTGTRNQTASLVAGAAVLAAALLSFSGSLGHGFVLDDLPEVERNALVHSLRDAPRLVVAGSWEGAGGRSEDVPMWRPATSLSYALNWAATGPSPFGFHLVNLLLHGLASVLVLVLALRAGIALPGATFAGLLFAVMPIHAEAVANVAGRKELLVAVFALGTVLAHARAMRSGGAWLALPPVLAALAMLSKESGVAVVGAVGAWDLLLGRSAVREHPRRAAALYVAYGGLAIGFVTGRNAVLGTLVFPATPFDENPLVAAAPRERIMTAVAVIGRGLAMTILPTGSSADYSFAAIPVVQSPADPRFLAGIAAILGAGVTAALAARRFPVVAFSLLWYAITLFPASNLLVVIGTLYGERLLYVPSVGVALVAGAGAAAAFRSRARPVALAAAGVLLLALGASAWQAARPWSDALSLFSTAVRSQPDSSKARRMLAGQLVEAGRPAEAIPHLVRAVEILGPVPAARLQAGQARVELGVALEAIGRGDDAGRIYAEVLAADPHQPDALWRRGVLRWQQGAPDLAVADWRGAVDANPRHARALNDLGIAAWTSGDAATAADLWRRATVADPTLASAWYRLALARDQAGDAAGAQAALTRFLDLDDGRNPGMREDAMRRLRAGGPPPR